MSQGFFAMNSAIPKIYMVTGIHVNKMWRDDQGGAFINFPVLRLKNIYSHVHVYC